MLGPATPAAQKRHPSGGKEWRFKFHAPAALEDEGQPCRFNARRSIRFPVERWQANSPPARPFVPASLTVEGNIPRNPVLAARRKARGRLDVQHQIIVSFGMGDLIHDSLRRQPDTPMHQEERFLYRQHSAYLD